LMKEAIVQKEILHTKKACENPLANLRRALPSQPPGNPS
jgi:hypothetical protein